MAAAGSKTSANGSERDFAFAVARILSALCDLPRIQDSLPEARAINLVKARNDRKRPEQRELPPSTLRGTAIGSYPFATPVDRGGRKARGKESSG